MRLLFWILLLSSIFTVMATMIQIYTDYRESRQALEISLEKVQETVLPSISVAMWKLDKEVMESILNGLLTQRDTIYVEIIDTYANPIIQMGETSSNDYFERIYPIMFTDKFEQQIEIGKLKIIVTLSEIYRQLMDKVLVILMTQGVKTFIMSICIVILIDLLVIRHLNHLADWAFKVELFDQDQLLTLNRKQLAKGDVLDRVVSGINTMQFNLIKALAKREQAERLINSIVENSPSLICSKDVDGYYTLVNQKFLSVFNLERGQVIGHNDSEIFSQSQTYLLQKYELIVKEKAKPVTFEQEIERNGQLKYYVSLKFPIFDDKGALLYMGGISTDITDRRHKEQQILELNEELENKVTIRTEELKISLTNLQEAQSKLVESEKMSALGGLVAGVAHEINTPLGVIVTASSHISDIIIAFEKQYESNHLSRSAITELITNMQDSSTILIRNLLRVTKLIHNFKQIAVDQSSEHKRQFELKAYLEEVIQSLTPLLREGQHTIMVESDQEIMLISFPGAIAKIMTNLIINSVKHGFKEMTKGDIHINLTLKNEEVHIDYKDNGSGLDSAQRKKVFDPFYTTARFTGGCGLGMSISYNLVTAKFKGQISCIESLNGAHFKIRFPVIT